MSVIVALLPMVSGVEEGSDLLESVALVLIGGLLTSTLLTLVFATAKYTVFDDLEQPVLRLARLGQRSAADTTVDVEQAPGRNGLAHAPGDLARL